MYDRRAAAGATAAALDEPVLGEVVLVARDGTSLGPSRSPGERREGGGVRLLPRSRLARRRPDRRDVTVCTTAAARPTDCRDVSSFLVDPDALTVDPPAVRGRRRGLVAGRRRGSSSRTARCASRTARSSDPSCPPARRVSPLERRDLLEAGVRLVAPRLGVRGQGERHLRGLLSGEPGRPARRGAAAGERRPRDPRHRRRPQPRALPARLREPGRARRPGARSAPRSTCRCSTTSSPSGCRPARDLRPPPERQRPGRSRGRAHAARVLGPRAAPRQLHAERLLPLAGRQRRQGRGALPLHRPRARRGSTCGWSGPSRRPRRARGPRGLGARPSSTRPSGRRPSPGRGGTPPTRSSRTAATPSSSTTCPSGSRSTTRRRRSASASRTPGRRRAGRRVRRLPPGRTVEGPGSLLALQRRRGPGLARGRRASRPVGLPP